MKRSAFTEEQIVAILREQEAGAKTTDAGNYHEIRHQRPARPRNGHD